MSEIFTGNRFDDYAYQMGGWVYDNGWRYQDEFFGAAYVGKTFGDTEDDCLLMLREGGIPGRTIILHKQGNQLTEIWSGQVDTREEFDKMMRVVNNYSTRYHMKKR
jgi:hypothetical protein